MADIQSNIKFNIDTSDAMASIKALQAQISAFQTQMAKGSSANAREAKNLQRTLIDNINATNKFAASVTSIKTTTESFTTSLEKNKLSLREYFRYAGGASKSFGKLFTKEFETINKVARERVKDLQTQYIQLGRDANGAMQAIKIRPLVLDMENLGTKTAIAAQRQQLLNQLLKQGSTNLLNFGKNTQWAGRQLMVGFTIPLGILGQTAVKTFMDMETQAIKFKRVYGDLFTTTQETNKALKDIRALATEFTKYGVAASKTMELAAQAAATGKVGADLLSQVNQANRLAVLGNVEQQQALETTMSLTNAFGISADKLAQKINFLNAVENQTVTSIEDLTTAIPKAGPVIKQLGGSVEDLAFFLTAMREGGINASEGANALKSGLAALINPTAKASEMLSGFGINVKQIVESNAGNVRGIVIDFAKALDTLDPLNRARAIEQLFGKFQFSRLSTLFQNVVRDGTQAARVLDLTASSSSQLAALANSELKKLAESPMYKFQKAVEDIKVQLAPVGEEFLKAITPIVQFGTDVLKSFNNLDSGVKQFIVNLTGIVGGIGPILLMTFGLLANGAANIIKLFALMKSGFNNLGKTSTDLAGQTQYLTTEQIQASSVAASLDQVHSKLRQTFTLEASALEQLTAAYQRNIAASGMRPGILGGKRFAGGGMVFGPGSGTSDSIPALLSNGEYVVNAKATKQALPLLEGINSGKVAQFAMGGQAGKGLSGSTKPSLYGGQSKVMAPITMQLPGNFRGGFGMDEKALGSYGFIESLRNTLANDTLIQEGTRRTQKALQSVGQEATNAATEITMALRETSDELKASGKAATHISQVFDAAKPKIDRIVSGLSAQGGRGALMANTVRALASPTDQDILEGKYYRTPAVRMNPDGTIYKNTWFKSLGGRAKAFFGGIKSTERALGTPNFSDVGISSPLTAAHIVSESRTLPGPVLPLAGGVLGQSEATIKTASAKIKEMGDKYINSLSSAARDGIEQGFDKATKRNSPPKEAVNAGKDYGNALNSGVRDGIDDAKTAGQQIANAAVNGIVTGGQSGTARRATLAQGSFVPPGTQSNGRRRRRVTTGELIYTDAGYVDANTIQKPSATTSKKPRGSAKLRGTIRGLKSGFINPGKVVTRGGFGLGAVAGMASMVAPPEMQGMLNTVSMVSSVVGMFGGVLGKVVPLLLRFAGPIGIAITAITALGFVVKMASDAEKKRIADIQRFGKAQVIGKTQKEAAGSFFGKEITGTRDIRTRSTSAVGARTAQSSSDVLALTKDESFKKAYSKTASDISKMTPGQRDATLKRIGFQLRGQGYSDAEVRTQLQAIAYMGKTTAGSGVGSKFGFGTKEGQAALGTSISAVGANASGIGKVATTYQRGYYAGGSVTYGGTTAPTTDIGKTNLSSAVGGTISIMQSLKDQYQSGLISANQYRRGINQLAKQFKSLGKETKQLYIDKLLAEFDDKNLNKMVNATKDINEQFAILVMYQNDMLSADQQAILNNGTRTDQAIEIAKIMGTYKKTDFGKITDKNSSTTTALERRLEATQKKIDKLQIGLDIISYKEDKINKTYDARIAALDKVKQANEEIAQQQQMQLDLADAISRGDIASAARAAQESRAASAASALEKQGSAIESQRQAALSAITIGGKNRTQIEDQIAKLQYLDNVYQFGNTKFTFAKGGLVPSYFAAGGFALGTDTVPAMLTPGEFVIKKSAVDRIGVGNLNKINGYANGGEVKTGNSSANSMYNSYSINLSVNSNSDADDIANKVMDAIRRVESQNIRSNRF